MVSKCYLIAFLSAQLFKNVAVQFFPPRGSVNNLYTNEPIVHIQRCTIHSKFFKQKTVCLRSFLVQSIAPLITVLKAANYVQGIFLSVSGLWPHRLRACVLSRILSNSITAIVPQLEQWRLRSWKDSFPFRLPKPIGRCWRTLSQVLATLLDSDGTCLGPGAKFPLELSGLWWLQLETRHTREMIPKCSLLCP
jgi:hypothetical protein